MTTSTTTFSTNTTASNESTGASTSKPRQLENFTGAAAATTPSPQQQNRFTCYLATKSGKLCQYELALNPSTAQVQIISSSKQKVKSTLELATIHAKETPKQPRQQSQGQTNSTSDDDTAEDSPKRAMMQLP